MPRSTPSTLLARSMALVATLAFVACPSPPEAPPGPTNPSPNTDARSPGAQKGGKGPSGAAPAPGTQPANQNPAPVGAATPSGNPTGPPVPPAEGPHAGEFDPNAGKGTESDPMAQDLRLVPPQKTQAAIQGGAHYTLSGSITGSCEGSLRVDVLQDLDKPPAPGSAPPGPLAALDLSSVGSFKVHVPQGEKVSLSAVCDSNGDGVISSTEPVSEPGAAEGLSAAKSGIALKLGVPAR